MTTKPIAANPSLEVERKQAETLVDAVNHGDPAALQRVRAQLGELEPPISRGDAELVIAKEYGFDDWTALRGALIETSRFQSAVDQAHRAIADNDVARLRTLIADHPALLEWRDPLTEAVLLSATTSYANWPGAEAERHWNRPDCASLLLDAGAVNDGRVTLRLVDTGAHEMLALFRNEGALPENLRTLAAMGNLDDVRGCFEGKTLTSRARPAPALIREYDDADKDWPDPRDDLAVVSDAFLYACRLGKREVAAFLLDRAKALDPDLTERLGGEKSLSDPIDYLIDQVPVGARFDLLRHASDRSPGLIWQVLVELELHEALQSLDVTRFRQRLSDNPDFLESNRVDQQIRLLEIAAYSADTLPIIRALLESGAAVATMEDPPISPAISYAVEYGHAARYVPQLSKVWPVPDDLPHAAGLGDRLSVGKWFDADGNPELGDVDHHNPFPEHHPRVGVQDILDRSLAWAVQNAEYDVADYLLARGANIDTRWSTHEPASILHECAAAGRLEQCRYLVNRGIDLTTEDSRFRSTAEGWARFGGWEAVADYLARAASR